MQSKRPKLQIIGWVLFLGGGAMNLLLAGTGFRGQLGIISVLVDIAQLSGLLLIGAYLFSRFGRRIDTSSGLPVDHPEGSTRP